ncbi:hypothetical protein LMIY3S_05086 [Labrys miyagiensis]
MPDTMPGQLRRFIEDENAANTALIDYLWQARANYQTLTAEQRIELAPERAKFLYANNAKARVAVATAALDVAGDIRKLIGKWGQAHWVTIAIDKHAMSVDEAAQFNITSLQSFTRQMLKGFNFLGIVEAGLYGNYRIDPTDKGRKTVSWHTHAIAWGVSEKEMETRKAEINARYQSLIRGPTPAHSEPIRPRSVRTKLIYMLKGQRKEYRIIRKKGDVIDPETGEITEEYTGEFDQRTQNLRPGDRVRMCRVLARKCIDQMLFAGGAEGREVLKDFRQVILREFEQVKDEFYAKTGEKWT